MHALTQNRTVLPPATPSVADISGPRATPKRTCRHCGAGLIDERMRETGFCCAGCAYVFRLVHEHGLAGYYRIKDDVTPPADAVVFQPRDYAWLEALQSVVEEGGAPVSELTLDIQGISCAACVWLIERVFQQQPGARDIIVNAQYGTMQLRWSRGEFSASEFARKLQAFGYLVGVPGEAAPDLESRGLGKRIGLCAAFAMNVMLFTLPTYFGMESTYEWAGLFALLNVVFGTLSVLVGGSYFLSRAFHSLREAAVHLDLPISIGFLGAYLGSLYGWLSGREDFIYFDFVSAFILLMLVGRWAQVAAVERNRRRLLSQQPKPARVRLERGGTVAPEQLRIGDALLLASGQVLPVEARLGAEAATFSLASINGEAEPREFRGGQRVPAGAVNLGRAEVRLVAQQTWSDSLLAQLLAPVERAGARHGLLDRIVKGYLTGIIGVALVAGIAWWWNTGDVQRTWAVVTAVLVVSCPCAVALAFPLADEIATVALRRRGVFIRSDDLWAKLNRVRKVVFDKTGTLTLETPALLDPAALAALQPEACAALLALVRDNPHPISQSLLEQLLSRRPAITPLAGEPRETVGFGVELGPWSLGRPGWRSTADVASLRDHNESEPAETEFCFHGTRVARFRFTDEARPDAPAEIAALMRRGYRVFILSGDRPEKVARVATELGLPDGHAVGGLTPAEKACWFNGRGADDVLMLGDGANDSLAFDRALCRGTPVIHRGVLERKADFYYLGRGIGGIRALFEWDATRRRTHRMILIFSVGYNVLAVGLAVAGRMNPLLAAALMPINSLVTLLLVNVGMRRTQNGWREQPVWTLATLPTAGGPERGRL